jgi:pimeloyl-ACP methyl ester carboxylesterase
LAARTHRPAGTARPPPRLRRAYYDCRYGQLHLHNAIPAGGGFDEKTSVICLHDAGETGRVFTPLLQVLGFERSVYSLDLPGSGESDPAAGIDPAEAAVQAVQDFIGSMRIRQFDLLARGEGCVAARRLAQQLAGAVQRLVLLGDAGAGVAPARNVLALPRAEADSPGLPARVLAFLAAGV